MGVGWGVWGGRGRRAVSHGAAAVSLMAAADSGVIPLEPVEESQCSPAGPGTCAITIKGYHRHSSTPIPPPLPLLLPALHLQLSVRPPPST